MLWVCLLNIGYAATDEEAVLTGAASGTPPTIGNFALPSPQQPGPLLSFGQTLIGRNVLQFSANTFSPYRIGGAFDAVNASLIYGITDETSLYFNYPLKADVTTRVHRTSGLLDATLQLEHAFYSSGNAHYQDQATILGAMTLPLQEPSIPSSSTGYGSPTYFGGATYSRTSVQWFGFVSPGVLLTTPSQSIRLGSQVLYQAGIGHNLLAVSQTSILSGLLEVNGQYTGHDEVFGRSRRNSGGNIVTLTPSMWFSTDQLIVQVGVGFPVAQQLFGNQTKMDYFVAANISWTPPIS